VKWPVILSVKLSIVDRDEQIVKGFHFPLLRQRTIKYVISDNLPRNLVVNHLSLPLSLPLACSPPFRDLSCAHRLVNLLGWAAHDLKGAANQGIAAAQLQDL
jgi:hypothetical protein